MKNPLFVTIPHSGEKIPDEAEWLKGLSEPVQMCDVDRFVDVLYRPALDELELPHIVADWHRYVVDLNRLPGDIDQASVVGAEQSAGVHPTGFHWVVTTKGDQLMRNPISMDLHDHLTKNYWRPFHDEVEATYRKLSVSAENPVFQLDAHSMPSMGTEKHRDPGESRAEIVISDQNGKSCDADYRDLVVESYRSAGFEVKTNWPYLGGRVTQTYGQPQIGQNCIQVELNRALYMNEETKQLNESLSQEISQKIKQALAQIQREMPNL